MNTYPPSHAVSHPALALATRIDGIFGGLCLLIAARFRILGALTNPVWTRFSRARQRLACQIACNRDPLFASKCDPLTK